MTELVQLAERLGLGLRARGIMLVTAESCTGGWLAQIITAVPGSSKWFDRGFVTYSNASKQEMLGVPASILQEYGAVSEACVKAMAAGAIAHANSDLAVSISGIAGPGGATPDKPVGTVWVGWTWCSEKPQARVFHFEGDRQRVREQAVHAALDILLAEVERRQTS